MAVTAGGGGRDVDGRQDAAAGKCCKGGTGGALADAEQLGGVRCAEQWMGGQMGEQGPSGVVGA